LRARTRTSTAIKALLELAPKTARVIQQNGNEQDVAVEPVVLGDRIRVRSGEKVRSMANGWKAGVRLTSR